MPYNVYYRKHNDYEHEFSKGESSDYTNRSPAIIMPLHWIHKKDCILEHIFMH